MSDVPALPPGACDCHTHVMGDPAVFPMVATRHYTPAEASVDDLRTHLARLGLTRVVIVQPSIYGTDNRCMVEALDTLGDLGRGVAVLDDTAGDVELDALHAHGVRGLRLNLESVGARDPARIRAALACWSDRLAARGWHLQIFAALDALMTVADDLADLSCRVVLDHFAMVGEGMEPTTEPARTLLALMTAKRVHVKLSGAYRIAPGATAAVKEALARRWSDVFLRAAPTQLLWASDWPHTDREPGRRPHEVSRYRDVASGALARSLVAWLPDEASRRRVLVDNAAAVYGF